MPYKLPYPLPQAFDRSNQFANPGQTLPVPGPSGPMPVPCWFASPTNVFWQATTDYPNGYATWNSPLFDLRPNLRGFSPYGYSGSNNTTQRATPVWSGGGTGAGGKLFVQISNLQDQVTGLNNLEVLAQEYGHIADPGKAVTLTPQEDITTSVNSTTDSVVLTFMPLGEGMPIRFWKLLMIFRKTASGSANAPFQIEAAYY
jgi:hypothetical protein